jgi:glycosyltransferase involved in cell wall biosynthesis
VRLENFLVASAQTEQLAGRVLSAFRPDVVHVHHLIGISPRVVSAAQRLGAAVVVTLHDYYFPCPLVHLTKKSGLPCDGPAEGEECARTCFATELARADRWLLRYRYFAHVLGLAERVICPSADVAARAQAMAPGADIELAPLGITQSGRDPGIPRRSGALRLGYFGTVAPHKGLDVLLDALERSREPVGLLVAGPSPEERYRRSLEQRAAGAQLDVEWRGPFPAGDVASLLASVDAVVAPSQVPEVFPLAAREALAHGTPVIAARQPGLIDVVVDEVNGLLFSPGNAAELAACIERLSATRQLVDELGSGAADTVSVSKREHARDLLSLYARVVDGPRSSEHARIALDRLHAEAIRAGFAGRSRASLAAGVEGSASSIAGWRAAAVRRRRSRE